jgi:hypothetical protein
MRLFRATSTYVYIFCAYALNALVLLLHSVRSPLSPHKPPDLLVLIPMVVGMAAGALFSFISIRSTTNLVEKTVLILTGVLCLLFLVSVLPEIGYEWASFPFSYAIFVIVSCAAAVLAGIRVLQLARSSEDRSALP